MIQNMATTFTEIHDKLEAYREDRRWIFRGQSNARWVLLPKAGRIPFTKGDDSVFFEAWKRHAVAFIQLPANCDDWDWLAVAQHHGLATRFLDWTIYPLVALYFAVCEQPDVDGALYAFRVTEDRLAPPSAPKVYHSRRGSPFERHGISVFYPPSVVPRIVRQGGLFMVHTPPVLSLEETSPTFILKKITIGKSAKDQILLELDHYGINVSTVTPDLDGLSRYINWKVAAGPSWNSAERRYFPEAVPPKLGQFLRDLHFPAQQADLVAQAKENGADQGFLKVLEKMTKREYASMADVVDVYTGYSI